MHWLGDFGNLFFPDLFPPVVANMQNTLKRGLTLGISLPGFGVGGR